MTETAKRELTDEELKSATEMYDNYGALQYRLNELLREGRITINQARKCLEEHRY